MLGIAKCVVNSIKAHSNTGIGLIIAALHKLRNLCRLGMHVSAWPLVRKSNKCWRTDVTCCCWTIQNNKSAKMLKSLGAVQMGDKCQ